MLYSGTPIRCTNGLAKSHHRNHMYRGIVKPGFRSMHFTVTGIGRAEKCYSLYREYRFIEDREIGVPLYREYRFIRDRYIGVTLYREYRFIEDRYIGVPLYREYRFIEDRYIGVPLYRQCRFIEDRHIGVPLYWVAKSSKFPADT